ncbi:hypothetical protein DSM01_2561 [Leeuwenhoekiella palythoae]|uniref:Glycine dehydrogenase n=1 Tax=Leeuwenhoekiella palythoae TaxID=573501 RepID=A0ABY0D0N6_9FLAO|nr:hypothetical protein DSM01_2561 [Leeuwenhoekiella palythoae]
MKLFINCKEARQICDRGQYEEISFMEKLSVKLHRSICSRCVKYSERNAKLTHLLKDSKCKHMTPECKKRIREELERELAKTPE